MSKQCLATPGAFGASAQAADRPLGGAAVPIGPSSPDLVSEGPESLDHALQGHRLELLPPSVARATGVDEPRVLGHPGFDLVLVDVHVGIPKNGGQVISSRTPAGVLNVDHRQPFIVA